MFNRDYKLLVCLPMELGLYLPLKITDHSVKYAGFYFYAGTRAVTNHRHTETTIVNCTDIVHVIYLIHMDIFDHDRVRLS